MTSRPRTTLLAGALLVVALSGCAERVNQGVPASNSAAAQQEGSEPSHSDASLSPTEPAGSIATIDQRSADQIAGAVGSAQATLDELDQDFAGDGAAAGN